jgi:hypothetical protein
MTAQLKHQQIISLNHTPHLSVPPNELTPEKAGKGQLCEELWYALRFSAHHCFPLHASQHKHCRRHARNGAS